MLFIPDEGRFWLKDPLLDGSVQVLHVLGPPTFCLRLQCHVLRLAEDVLGAEVANVGGRVLEAGAKSGPALGDRVL